MPLHRLTDAELRAACRATIETLEIWLRRVIELELRLAFGDNYLHAQNPITGKHLLKKSLREGIQRRLDQPSKGYSRSIDAAMLTDVIYIVCHSDLYDQSFRPYFGSHYPQGRIELQTFLKRLIEPRNALAHSNPLSVRQAEQVICYSHDVIDAIKERLEVMNMGKDYNAPMIMRITDSRGFVFNDTEIMRNSTGRGQVNLAEDREAWLRVGDTLGIEVEVDPSFSPSDYQIEWIVAMEPQHSIPSGNRLVLNIRKSHINYEFTISCKVISNKWWHRCGDVDDAVGITYRVLPVDP